MIKLNITENQANQRLDRFLKKYYAKAPLSMIYRMIRKDVKLNGKRAKEDTVLSAGDELTLYITEEESASLMGSVRKVNARKQFKIVYEDENILVANKPFGLLTHGDRHEKKNHLANQVMFLYDNADVNLAARPAGAIFDGIRAAEDKCLCIVRRHYALMPEEERAYPLCRAIVRLFHWNHFCVFRDGLKDPAARDNTVSLIRMEAEDARRAL